MTLSICVFFTKTIRRRPKSANPDGNWSKYFFYDPPTQLRTEIAYALRRLYEQIERPFSDYIQNERSTIVYVKTIFKQSKRININLEVLLQNGRNDISAIDGGANVSTTVFVRALFPEA